MEFESWQEWSGKEAAFFVSTFCDLPQYDRAIAQNFTGEKLRDLYDAGMLPKGLARAGISDFHHQQRIAAAVGRLNTEHADALNVRLYTELKQQGLRQELDAAKLREQLQQQMIVQVPVAPKPNCLDPRSRHLKWRVGMDGPISLSFAPKLTTAMLRQETDTEHHSSDRFTPRIRDFADEPPVQVPVGKEDVVEVTKLMRERLAQTLTSYEKRRQAELPLYGTVPKGEAPTPPPPPNSEPLPPRSEKTDPKPPKNSNVPSRPAFRPFGKRTVRMMEQPMTTSKSLQMDQACVKIQANFRGRRARKETAILDPANGGLRGIQKIQAVRQQRKALEEKKAKHERMMATERSMPWAQHSILDTMTDVLNATGDLTLDTQNEILAQTRENASSRQSRYEDCYSDKHIRASLIIQSGYRMLRAQRELQQHKDQIDAAVKLQTMQRARLARKKVASMKRVKMEPGPSAKDGDEDQAQVLDNTGEGETAEGDGMMNDKDPVRAATVLQANWRGRFTRREMEQFKINAAQRARELAEQKAAIKIQATQRKKAAMREFEARRRQSLQVQEQQQKENIHEKVRDNENQEEKAAEVEAEGDEHNERQEEDEKRMAGTEMDNEEGEQDEDQEAAQEEMVEMEVMEGMQAEKLEDEGKEAGCEEEEEKEEKQAEEQEAESDPAIT